MKKIFIVLFYIFVISSFVSCIKSEETVIINGETYNKELVMAGYYLDKASLSEAQLLEAIDKIEVIQKPKNLGITKLIDLSSIEVNVDEKEEVTDAMVEGIIEEEKDKELVYSLIKTKRECVIGDKVCIDYTAKVDGMPFNGSTANDLELILGENTLGISNFDEQIVGHKAGQSFTVDVYLPSDFKEASVRYKLAAYDVIIKYIMEPSEPELNQEFIEKHSITGVKTLEDYKQEKRQLLEQSIQYLKNQEIFNNVFNKLVTESDFSPNQEGLAYVFSNLIVQMNNYAKSQGTNLIKISNDENKDLHYLLTEMKLQSEELIKQDMVFDALEKNLNVKLTDDDLKKWFDNISILNGYGSDIKYENYVKTMGIDYIKYNARLDKIINETIKKVKVTYNEVTE